VELMRAFGAHRLRLFFGRLPCEGYGSGPLAVCVRNIRRVADRHRDVSFVFENHDGASSRPDVCQTILGGVERPNVRLAFDPINFEHRGVRSMDALAILAARIGHVHLKGYRSGAFCGFGEGDVDLMPTLRALISGGYRGGFTVEYEGEGDRTVRLFESLKRAREAVRSIRNTL
jgi:sugar phosphate isomerase/epimerase